MLFFFAGWRYDLLNLNRCGPGALRDTLFTYHSVAIDNCFKKPSSVPHEYSNESLDSHSGLATALASAIFGEKNCSKWLDFSIALSPQGRGLQTSLLLWGAICVKKAEVGHMMICVITYHQCDSPYGYVDIHIIYVDLHLHM